MQAKDVIDIYSEPKVQIKLLKADYHKAIHVQLDGVDASVVNAIRRTVMEDIPVYGIHRSNIIIDHKKCNYMYNNDLVYCQLESLPIFDIPNDFDLENPLLYLNTPELQDEFSTFIPSNATPVNTPTKKIVLGINYKNNSTESYYVSTHDVVLNIDGKVVDTYKKHPRVDIIVLKPGQEVHLKATATLGIAKFNSIWEATTLAIHEQIGDNKFTLKYETLGQLSQQEIFNKAQKIIVKQLTILRDYSKDIKPVGTKQFEQRLKGMDDTLGGVITSTLQKSKLVRSAGFVKEHMFTNTVLLRFELEESTKKDPTVVFTDVLSYLIKLFGKISV